MLLKDPMAFGLRGSMTAAAAGSYVVFRESAGGQLRAVPDEIVACVLDHLDLYARDPSDLAALRTEPCRVEVQGELFEVRPGTPTFDDSLQGHAPRLARYPGFALVRLNDGSTWPLVLFRRVPFEEEANLLARGPWRFSP